MVASGLFFLAFDYGIAGINQKARAENNENLLLLSQPIGADLTVVWRSPGPPPSKFKAPKRIQVQANAPAEKILADFPGGQHVEYQLTPREADASRFSEVMISAPGLAYYLETGAFPAGLLCLAGGLALGLASWRNREQVQEIELEERAVVKFEVGGRIDGYELFEELGRGATSQVFRVRKGMDGPVFAMKALFQEVQADPEFAQRFHREALIYEKLDHPHILRLQARGRILERNYLIFDLLEGGTLTKRLELQPEQPYSEVIRMGSQIAQGLAEAHRHEIIHRDLKPDNILVDRAGQMKISDFGLARSKEYKTITVTGAVVGTPAFMAPELVQGDKPSAACDLYSLGIILYEMTTGNVPFDRGDVLQTLLAQVTDPVPPLLKARPDCPPALAQLIEQLLEKDPARRPASADEVAQRLAAITL